MENAKLLHRQKVRFTIDIEVSVLDYPQAMIDKSIPDSRYAAWMDENPENAKEWLEFQKRLLHAVVNNPAVLSQFVIDDAGLEAASYFEVKYMTSRNEIPLEELLSPVVATMSEDDKKRIDEFIANRVLPDNTEIALYEPFRAKVINTIEILK